MFTCKEFKFKWKDSWPLEIHVLNNLVLRSHDLNRDDTSFLYYISDEAAVFAGIARSRSSKPPLNPTNSPARAVE